MGSTMMKQLQGKVAFITGAGRGIGAGIASVLASRGASVAVCDVDGSAAQETADQINGAGGRVIAGAIAVTDPDSLQQFTSLAIVELGSIDICVPNAGVIGGKGFSARKDFTKQDWDLTFAVNVHGVANTVDSVKQHMMDREQGKWLEVHVGRHPLSGEPIDERVPSGFIQQGQAQQVQVVGPTATSIGSPRQDGGFPPCESRIVSVT